VTDQRRAALVTAAAAEAHVCRDREHMGLTSMSEETENREAERQRLLAELEQLEQQQRELNLRDRRAVDECLRKIEGLRRKIDALNLCRDVEAHTSRFSQCD
jgi:hypothetical protein